jgi:hypothetical protein
MRKKFFLATALVAVAATAGAGIVFAAGAVSTHEGGPEAASQSGSSGGAGCGSAWQTRTGQFNVYATATDPDDWEDDADTASEIGQFAKKCHGGAIVTFSTETAQEDLANEVGALDHWDDINVAVRAYCNHPGFSTTPCHEGDIIWALPGGAGTVGGGLSEGVFFDHDPQPVGDMGVRSFQWVFPNLRPGYWNIQVRVASEDNDPDGKSHLGWRTLFFETL